MIRRLMAALLKAAFWLMLLAFLFGQLPGTLLWWLLALAWAVLTWPLVALPAPLGSLVLAVLLALAAVAFVHDAVLEEDYKIGEQKLREVYQRRKWLPW